jgi:hypothetical protein
LVKALRPGHGCLGINSKVSPEAPPRGPDWALTLSFGSGHYTIAVAYAEDGEHRVAQTAFEIDRRSVSFFRLWFSFLWNPIGPCG